jgi:RHS repeat-associated protein
METKLREKDITSNMLTDNGYVTLSDSKYHFYYKDHEGNNRVVADQSNTVEQVNNYYPFGLSYRNDASTNANKYKYKGKELQTMHGLDWYDYGARFYDPELCQWHAIDPSCEKYYDVSPYVYCAGNPIKLIDSNGKDVWLFATRLPTTTSGDEKSWIPLATHTFIVVIGKDRIPHYYAYGGDYGYVRKIV